MAILDDVAMELARNLDWSDVVQRIVDFASGLAWVATVSEYDLLFCHCYPHYAMKTIHPAAQVLLAGLMLAARVGLSTYLWSCVEVLISRSLVHQK